MSARELVEGFGGYNFSVSEVHRPATVDELRSLVRSFFARGIRPIYRGLGRSYGDAATNPDGPVVELRGLRAIRGLDESTGVLAAEAGVSFEEIWRHGLPKGLWPPVVPGTMHVTLGGAVAMNIHGKNGWRMGNLGDHVEAVTVLDERGELRSVEKKDPALRDVVSIWGSTRPIVEVRLALKRVETGYLEVTAIPTRNLAEMLALLDDEKERHEYLVGWIDAFASGTALGRGAVHLANVVKAGRLAPGAGLSVEEQMKPRGLSDRLPKGLMKGVLRASTFDLGMRVVNEAKYRLHQLSGRTTYIESLVAYSFLLDFIPGWQDVYRPGGFIQYQMFVPKERAAFVLTEAIRRQHELGVPTYLAVLKRHRRDSFRSGYVPDGYSLALDFPVTEENAGRLITLCRGYDALLAANGGAPYKAKDCVGSLSLRWTADGSRQASMPTSSRSEDTTSARAPVSVDVPNSSVPASERQ